MRPIRLLHIHSCDDNEKAFFFLIEKILKTLCNVQCTNKFILEFPGHNHKSVTIMKKVYYNCYAGIALICNTCPNL